MNRDPSPLGKTLDAFVFCSLLVLTGLLACFPNQDMDIWWHLKAGREILQGNGIPTQDTWTIAAAGHEWIDLHWLFQVVAAYQYTHFGMSGLTIVGAALAVLAIAAGVLGSSTRAVAPFVAVLWFPAILVMSSRFLMRPEIISLTCLAVYLGILRHAEINPKYLWLLVPIQLFWVNVQGLFCFGPFLLACWLIDRWWHGLPEQRRHLRRDTALPVISVLLSCFANPYGWRGAVFPISLARTMFVDGSFYRDRIGELASPLAIWQATGYRDIYVWAAVLLLAMTLGSFFMSEVSIRVFRLTVLAVFSGMGLVAVRNLPQFALVAASILTLNLAEPALNAKRLLRYGLAVRLVSLATLMILSWSLVWGSFYPWIGSSRVLSLKEFPYWHAHDAARFAAREGMPGEIVAFHEGQAALVEFHMRDPQRVFADPRLEVMQRPAMERYYQLAEAIAKGDETWRNTITSPIAFVIDHSSHYQLEVTLLADPDWDCVWFGPVAAVYVPKSAGSAPRDPSGDLPRRHFGNTVREPDRPADDPQQLRSGMNSNLMEATALLNIARAAGDRPTGEGIDRRVWLLLATRLARAAMGELPYAAGRIGAGTAFQMYGAPTTPIAEWQLMELLGPARSRYLLHRCQALRPGDFASLAEEYAVASALRDPDAIFFLSRQLAVSKAQSAQQFRLRAIVRQGLNAANLRANTGKGSFVDPADDVDTQAQALFESRRFLRLSSRFARDPDGMDAATRGKVALACFVSGDPQSARRIWQLTADEEADSGTSVRIGMTYLAEQDHAKALEYFERAVQLEPSNPEALCALAVCHLELGNAYSATLECQVALEDPDLDEGLANFCERLGEFAKRHRVYAD